MGTRLAAEGATDRASQIAAIDLFVVLTSFSTVWSSLFTVEDGRRPQVPNPPGCGTGKRSKEEIAARPPRIGQRTILKPCPITPRRYRDSRRRWQISARPRPETPNSPPPGRHRPGSDLFMQLSPGDSDIDRS